MKKWQARAIVKSSDINFLNDIDKISSIYIDMCNELVNYEGISFDEDSKTLYINDTYYRLEVTKCFIRIKYLSNIGSEVEYLLGVDPVTKEYAYSNSTNRSNLEFLKMYETNFNYEEILDTLMSKVID